MPMIPGHPDPAVVAHDVANALREDIGAGDLSAALVAADTPGQARVLAREAMVLAGQAWFERCFIELDATARIDWHFPEGARIAANEILCHITANARALLSAERSALNFLQTLSATATTTAAHAALVEGTGTRILDTRKTLPGLRYAQKYAVKVGGGENHRLGLYDAVLIKENHIAAAGGIAPAIARARATAPGLLVEVEVESLDEYRQAIEARPDRIMLDELSDADLATAVALRPAGIELEVSGGVDADRLKTLAHIGVDYVSIGALTKHVRAVDLSLRWVRTDRLAPHAARQPERPQLSCGPD